MGDDKRVEVRVGKFMLYDPEAVKPNSESELHLIQEFLKGFPMAAAKKLVKEHGFDVTYVGEALDRILYHDKQQSIAASEQLKIDIESGD